MRSLCALVVVLIACRPISAEAPSAEPATPTPSRIAPLATAEPPRPGAERFQLVFAASQESSCSQSWDFSQWSGTTTLRTTAEGPAHLEMAIQSSSTGGAWDGSSAPDHYEGSKRCAFLGRVEAVGDRMTFTFGPVVHEPTAFECAPAYRGEPYAKAEDPWILRCHREQAELPTRHDGGPRKLVSVLACRSEGNVPWLWRLLDAEGDAIRLGVDRVVHATAHDTDSLIGTLDGVAQAPGSHQWVEP